MSPKTIGLIDPVPLLRSGMAVYLADSLGVEVFWDCCNPTEALELLSHCVPDLIITAAVFPCRQSALNLLDDLRARHIKSPVLVYSSFDEHLFAARVLHHGGRGYLMKTRPAEDLAEAVSTVLAGRIFLSPAMKEVALNTLAPGGSSRLRQDSLPGLTDRELEVFEMIGEGMKSREIAKALGVSIRTIETHRAHMREKLGISHGISLVAFACQWMALKQADLGSEELVSNN